jgi:hypothetical protein
LLHALAKTVASFDDPHLVSHAGLVAGMAAGAGSIDDMDVLRHGAMGTLFGGIRAPSTLGSHLRSCTWGNVSQLEKAGREFLAELARRAPLLPGARTLAFTDIDSMQKRVHGHARQGAKFGHAKIQGKSLLVRGLNALAAVISTPIAAPVIGATRLRGGNAGSPFELVQAETRHRGHAVVEQVFADVTSGPLAHLPSVISSRFRAVFDVRDGGFLPGVVRGGRGYLAPSITEMTGVLGARAACGDAVGCGVVDGSRGRRGSGRAGGPVPGVPELGGEVAEHGEVVCP